MKDYKLLLYAIYFILLDIAFNSYGDINRFFNLSLILILISIGQDIYKLIKKPKSK